MKYSLLEIPSAGLKWQLLSFLELVRIMPRERVDGLKVKLDGSPREASTGVWVGRVCDIFLVSQNLVSNYVVNSWDGWMDGWMSPVKQSISVLSFTWLPKMLMLSYSEHHFFLAPCCM